jgi:hypothetical protein
MASGFFDTPEVSGFTWRTFYKEVGGIVTITDLQLRSRVFGGPDWYPGGEISVNGIVILKMDYDNPATHVFDITGASDKFVSCRTLNGQALPVSSPRLATRKAEIAVSVQLYRNQNTVKPELTGSVEIPLTTGIVHVKVGGEVKRCRAVVKIGDKIKPCMVGTIHEGKFTPGG